MKIRSASLATALAAILFVSGLAVADPASAQSRTQPPAPTPGVGFMVLSPQRVLDTRDGTGTTQAPLGPGEVRLLDLTTATAGVPVGATAVVLALTGIGASANTFVTAWQDKSTRPDTQCLTVNPGETLTTETTVALGADRTIDLYNKAGNLDLTADLEGYYMGPGLAAAYTPMRPARVLDTRSGVGAPREQLHGGVVLRLDLSSSVPAGATAVVLNLTGINPSAQTFVTAYPDGQASPNTRSLTLQPGQPLANEVTVALGGNRVLDLYNQAGDVDLIGDLEGFYGQSPTSGFTAATPQRILDTRTGTGTAQVPLGPGEIRTLDLANYVPAGTSAVVFTLTATSTTATTFVTAWRDGAPQPAASNLDASPGKPISNQITVIVGPDERVSIYNNAGNTDLAADLAGFFSFQA